MTHCDTCPFPAGTRCESTIPCIYSHYRDTEEHAKKAEFCQEYYHKLLRWQIAHIESVLVKLKKEVELSQHDISLLNTIYDQCKT